MNIEHQRGKRSIPSDPTLALRCSTWGVWSSMFAAVLALPLIFTTSPSTAAPMPEGLRSTTFVAFDTETTGLAAARDRLIEIGAIKFRDGETIAHKVWLINPERPIPAGTTAVHGIRDKDVAKAPLFKEVYPEFMAFVSGSIMVAHNAPFDLRFMAAEIQRNALPFPPEPVLDSLRLVRIWYPDLESHNLKAVADYLKVAPSRYHRAMDDTEALVGIFVLGLKQMPPTTTLSNLVEAAGSALYIKPTVALDGAAAQPTR